MFDDVTPADVKGGRPRMGWNELKHLTNVRSAEAVDARYEDIIIPAGCPRLFTSNALRPDLWMTGLTDVSSFTDKETMDAFNKNVEMAAIYKRVLFANVVEPLISVKRSADHSDSKISEAARKVARFL